jgi:hypothetical protein
MPARLLLLCLLFRSSWLTVEGGCQVSATRVIHRRGGPAAVAVPVGVAGGVSETRRVASPDRVDQDCSDSALQQRAVQRPIPRRASSVGDEPAAGEESADARAADETEQTFRVWFIQVRMPPTALLAPRGHLGSPSAFSSAHVTRTRLDKPASASAWS